jgi:ATP phosphoribosyltransferase regulatory subunit
MMAWTIPGVPDLAPDILAALDRIEGRVSAVLAQAGYGRVVPPILELAEPFIETSGEDIRRRLYAFSDPDGVEFCLRPDLTIPTCRQFLRNRQTGPARLSASGPAFRHQDTSSPRPRQFAQIDAELIDAADPVEADAEILTLALKCLRSVGIDDPAIRVGDLGLLSQVMTALEITPKTQARLRRALGRPEALAKVLEDAPGRSAQEGSAIVDALTSLSAGQAHRLVEEIIGLAGIAGMGGRRVDEIADRLVAKAQAASQPALSAEAARILTQYLNLSGPAPTMVERLAELTGPLGLDLSHFRRRLSLLQGEGVDLSRITFTGSFSRAIDYYTGMVFELDVPQQGEDTGPLAAGGRYDGLLARLGADREMPAIGFAFWPERVAALGGAL